MSQTKLLVIRAASVAVVVSLAAVALPLLVSRFRLEGQSEVRALRALEKRDFRKALEILYSMEPATREASWYILAADAQSALEESSEEAQGSKALDVLEKGIARYPRSSQLRRSRAYYYFSHDLFEEAWQALEEAEKVASANLQAARQRGEVGAEDEGVLRSVEQLRKNLSSARENK